MGANIGTTITGQLIALDIGALAPLFAFCGVAAIVFVKKQQVHHYGLIVAGLGILFIGMEMMSGAMMPLRESEAFVSLMTKFSNPVLGILAGMIFTALIQSSSASVGILQALASSGLIGLPNAVFVLFGQNIGTCITAVLAAIGTSRNAKRTTVIHLLFNIIGTTIFTVVCLLTPLTSLVESFTPGNVSAQIANMAKRTTVIHLLFNIIGTTIFTVVCLLTPLTSLVESFTPGNVSAQIANMHTLFNIATTLLLIPFGTYLAKLAVKILPTSLVESFTPGNVSAQIANMHTLFNIATTLLLIPFGTYLAKLAVKILPEKKEELEGVMHMEFIHPMETKRDTQIGLSAIAVTGIKNELHRMINMAKQNVDSSLLCTWNLFIRWKQKEIHRLVFLPLL